MTSSGSGIAYPVSSVIGGYQTARSDKNLMSLEEFRRELSYHPFHFWGLAGSYTPVSSSCNDTVREYAWQGADFVGRRDIALAIQAAEEKLRVYLGYSVAPHYVVESRQFPRYINPQFDRYGYAGSDARWLTITADEGKIISSGTERITVIGDARVAYSDTDGDGLDDVFTASIATTVTNSEEICAFFDSTDIPEGEDIAGNRDWEILPINVSIVGGIATIKGRAWQLVRPILYQGVSPDDALDAADSNNFVTTLMICHRTTYSGTTSYDSEAALIWETDPYPYACCGLIPPTITNSLDPAAEGIATARLAFRNADAGLLGVGLAEYDAVSGQWYDANTSFTKIPDRVIIRYCAGIPRVSRMIDPMLRKCVFRMAAAELARPICACDVANRELYRWQFDMARTGGSNDESYGAISRDDLDNPFGTRRGHIFAYRTVKDLARVTGFAL